MLSRVYNPQACRGYEPLMLLLGQAATRHKTVEVQAARNECGDVIDEDDDADQSQNFKNFDKVVFMPPTPRIIIIMSMKEA